MLKRFLRILAFMSIFLTLIFFQIRAQTLPENPVEGFRVFIDKGCARCHAIWGEGETVGPDLGKVKLEGSFLDLTGYIWNHFPYMQERMGGMRIEWPIFSPEELSRLISYLYSLEFFDVSGDEDRGRMLFSEKGCLDCHSLGGKGGKKGPDLEKFKRGLSPIFMVQAMWNHVPEMSALLEDQKSNWPVFRDNQLMDLLAFVHQKAKGEEREIPLLLIGSPKSGDKLFKERCVRCHGNGSGEIASDLRRNSKKFHQSMTQIAALLWNYAPRMWKAGDVPKFSGEEMADIISYLYFLNYPDRPGDSEQGRKISLEKGCQDCHYAGGPAVDFSSLSGKFSTLEMTTEMLNHASVMQKIVEKKKIPWPRFNPGELKDLFMFIGLKEE